MYQEKKSFNTRGGGSGYGGNNRGGGGNYGNNRFQRQDRRPQQRHNPLPEGFSLFYISIVCPEQIEAKVKGFKEHMEKQYGSRAARKSPAHLTVVPPFKAEDELEKSLVDFVETFNIGMLPVDISLNGYGTPYRCSFSQWLLPG